MAKPYKGFKNKKSAKRGKRRLKEQLGVFLKDKELSKVELRKIRKVAAKNNYVGSSKRLAKLIKRTAKSTKPKAFKKGRIEGVSANKNIRRLKKIKQKTNTASTPPAQTPFYGPLKDPTKPAPNTNFPLPPPGSGVLLGGPTAPGKPEVLEVPEVKEAPKPVVFTPEPHTPPPPGEPGPTREVGQKVQFDPPPAPEIDWKSLLKASQDTNNLLTKQLSQTRTPTAPTINVNVPEAPEPDEALGRAKSTSSYLSGGSAGGIRRRRSNRSKLGLSGLGTNQLNRNVSNLLSIRGISI